MRIVRRVVLVMAVFFLSLLALENLLIVFLMLEVGVPRAVWISFGEFAILASLSVVLIRRLRSPTTVGSPPA